MSVKEKTLLKNVNFNIENIINPWIPGARRIQKGEESRSIKVFHRK